MTRKRKGKSREHLLTHQLTCRIPRVPCHCRAGLVVDVAATGFPVTDECSGLFLPLVHPSVSVLGSSSTCCCPWRGTRSYRHVCLPPLERAGLACSNCMRSQPRGGTPQQAHACSRFLHYWTSLCTVMSCPDTRSVFTAPPGAKVGDVQLGRHMDPCHSPSTSARSAQGRRSTVTDSTRGEP